MTEHVVAKVGEIKEGAAKVVAIGDEEIAVFLVEGSYYAIDKNGGINTVIGDDGRLVSRDRWGWSQWLDIARGIYRFAAAHGISMMSSLVCHELAEATGNPKIYKAAEAHHRRVMETFLRKDRGVILERLRRDGAELPPPKGTAVVPGHAIESMWFQMHIARSRNDRATLDRKGNPITDVVALPVKDPFHLPRALIYCIEVLEQLY